jgi:hypothetical protein
MNKPNTKMIYTYSIFILLTFFSPTNSQILSCTQIGCPVENSLARCAVDDTTLTEIGATNLTTSLSTQPFSWTVGFTPEAFTNSSDQKRYYLGTPPLIDLRSRVDITGCALFFFGIPGLAFDRPDGTLQNLGTEDGTCANALGSDCVTDLLQQTNEVAQNLTSSGQLQCSELAQALQNAPPTTCTQAGTWNNITAQSQYHSL